MTDEKTEYSLLTNSSDSSVPVGSEDELAASIFGAVPKVPPERVRMEAETQLRNDMNILIIKGLPGNLTEVRCTGCERVYTMKKVKRLKPVGFGCVQTEEIGYTDQDGNDVYGGRETVCPYCEQTAKVIHVSDISRYGRRMKRSFVGTMLKVHGHAVVVCWVRDEYLFKEGRTVVEWNPGYAATLIRGRSGKLKLKSAPGAYDNMGSLVFYGKFRPRKRAELEFPKCDIWITSDGMTDGTGIERSRFHEYERQVGNAEMIQPDAYLKLWAKYPNVEAIVQAGGGNLLAGILGLAKREKQSNSYFITGVGSIDVGSWIDLREKKPHRMLGETVTKEEFRMIVSRKWTEDTLSVYLKARRKGVELSQEELTDLFDTDLFGKSGWERRQLIKRLLDEPEFMLHAIRYVKAQRNKGIRADARDLCDYWDMVRERIGDKKTMDYNLRWPSNLLKAHDREVVLKMNKRSLAENERIKEMYQKNLPYSYTDREMGIYIRPVKDVYELNKEGTRLHHCVASYAGKIGRGETEIFLIRKTEDAKTPYYTLEYKDGNVIQNRGLRNCERTEDVIRFEEKWIKYLASHEKQIKERLKRVKENVRA